MMQPTGSLTLENMTLPVQKYYVTTVGELGTSFRYTHTQTHTNIYM